MMCVKVTRNEMSPKDVPFLSLSSRPKVVITHQTDSNNDETDEDEGPPPPQLALPPRG